jgi:hypothetical protein
MVSPMIVGHDLNNNLRPLSLKICALMNKIRAKFILNSQHSILDVLLGSQ